MAKSNHIRAASFMCGAVLVFTLGDAITKQVTENHSTLAVLAIRCALGVPILLFLFLIFKVRLSFQILLNKFLIMKAAIFSLAILFFAEALKVNSLTSFYLIFFLFLPIFAFGIDFFWKGKIPSAVSLIVVALMAGFAVYPHIQGDSLKLGREAIPVIIAAFFYVSYLSYSEFIERIAEIDPLSSNFPNFFYGAIMMGVMSLGGSDFAPYFSVLTSVESISFTLLAAAFSVAGIILITRATDYDSVSKIAPYEYSVIIYALLLDRFLFGLGITQDYWISAIGILFCSVALTIVSEKESEKK